MLTSNTLRTVRPHEKERLAKQDEDDTGDSAHDGDQTKRNIPIVSVEHFPVSKSLQSV